MDNNFDMCKNPIEYYKDFLVKYILEDQRISKVELEDLSHLVDSFSLFIYNTDSAYKYNLTYLNSQYKKFVKFLESAIKKRDSLKKIIYEISQSSRLREVFESCPDRKKRISLSLNDFLVGYIDGKLEFSSQFNMYGGTREEKDDLITIKLKVGELYKIRTCKLYRYDNGKYTYDTAYIFSLVEMLLEEDS